MESKVILSYIVLSQAAQIKSLTNFGYYAVIVVSSSSAVENKINIFQMFLFTYSTQNKFWGQKNYIFLNFYMSLDQ